MPAISVLMPVWNGARNGNDHFLKMAVESIINQTFEDWEFIIVDDGSTDNTPSILKSYCDKRIQIIKQPVNGGIVSALNRGLAECTAPLVARQDADDISTVTRFEVQKKFLDDRPETAMCGTGMYVINEEGKLIMEICDRPCNYKVVRETLKSWCPIVHGSVMFRKDVMTKLGGYSPDSRFKHAEDYEMWVRMAKDHIVENIPGTTLYFHRNHGSKISEIYKGQQDVATKVIASIAKSCL